MRKSFPMDHKERRTYLSTVSGVASTKPELIRWFNDSCPALDIITTKSFQVTPNSGNREPVICETTEGNFGNSVGLRNPGLEASLPPIAALKEEGLSKWLNVSLSADNPDDFITLIKAFDTVADSVELNFSCPHAKKGFGASIGGDRETAAEYVRRIADATTDRSSLLFVKLTPNVSDIGSIAKAVIDAGADGIVAINTMGPIVHTDPVSSTPILQNALGGKGGMSGDWVFPRALECIREIRSAIGDDIPVIGMGGVSDGSRAAAMVKAGADAVGIGSALAHAGQENWPAYLGTLKMESDDILTKGYSEKNSRSFLRKGRLMEYRPYTVASKRLHSEDTLIITLHGSMPSFKAGEFVFIWIPGTGEKPFSVAESSPLTFIIKKRGVFTSSLFLSVNEGDTLYVRGPYGKGVRTLPAPRAVVVAGGTGEAVALPLAKMLEKDGSAMTFLVGTSVEGGRGILQKELSSYGSYSCVSDCGKPGRVLDYLPDVLRESGENTALYLIGPEIFMKNAARIAKENGMDPSMIMLSMEKNTMCGIGLCGECSTGGRLMCQEGTFMSLSFLESEGII